MDEKKELIDLCEKIKRMIPSTQIKEDATEPFTKFLMSLIMKGIDDSEVVCIKRAYNYFNHIMGTSNGSIPSLEIPKESKNLDEKMPKEFPKEFPKKLPEKLPKELPKKSFEPFTDDSKIKLLLNLFKKNNERAAITDMKTTAETVLMKIPSLNLSWVKDPIIPKGMDTLLGRLNYQVDIATLLHKLIPSVESEEILDATTNVLAIAQLALAQRLKGGASSIKIDVARKKAIDEVKQKAIADQLARTSQKLEEIVPDEVKVAQEMVIEKVRNMYDSI